MKKIVPVIRRVAEIEVHAREIERGRGKTGAKSVIEDASDPRTPSVYRAERRIKHIVDQASEHIVLIKGLGLSVSLQPVVGTGTKRPKASAGAVMTND